VRKRAADKHRPWTAQWNLTRLEQLGRPVPYRNRHASARHLLRALLEIAHTTTLGSHGNMHPARSLTPTMVVAGVYLGAIRPARAAGTAVSSPPAEAGEPPRAG
jgi:hypothetical protein